MNCAPFKDHWPIRKLFVRHYFLIFLSFLMVLITAVPSQGAPVVKLSQAIAFSSLVERGSDPDAMAFDSNGDLYYFGWNHGLEKMSADQIPDGTHQLLLDKSDYGPFFDEPLLSEIKNITGFGIGFSSPQKVISYIKGVYRKSGSDTDEIKIGFASCDRDGSNLAPLALTAGEEFIGLNRVKKAGGGYETLDVHQGEVFRAGDRDLFQMKMVDLNGSEFILFTLWGLPDIFQVSSSGGLVTRFYRFDDGYPRGMAIMGDDLIVTHNDGNIYRINLVSRAKSDFVTQTRLINFLGLDSGNICFAEIDYEPVSNRIYCVAQVCWNTDVPQTMMAISPDGLSITKILDENSLTQDLAGTRTPPEGKNLKIQAVSVNPVTVSQGKSSLFLGDYWSGLEMVRMDFPESVHTIYKNSPTGAHVGLDLGTGEPLLCDTPAGRLEGGPFHDDIFLPQGENFLQVSRNGILEDYSVHVIPAFSIVSSCKRGQVQLNWTHRPGITRYDIFRSSEDDPENFIKIAETVSTYSVYLDRSVTNEKTYLYTVAAVYDQSSEFSTVVAVTPSQSRRPGNFNPVIFSGPSPDETWTGSIFTYRVLALDSNGDMLSYSLANAPAGMTIDANGLITWSPDVSQIGIFNFTVTVMDGNGSAATLNLTTEIIPSTVPIVYSIQGNVIAMNMAIPGPLSGIKVSVGDQEVYTDDQGYFQITGLPEPLFKLQVDGWNRGLNRYAFMHYDIHIPEGQTGTTRSIYLPLIGSSCVITLDEKIADIEIQADGSTQAILKTELVLNGDKNGFNASLLIKKGTILLFPPGFDTAISLNYLGPELMPMSPPVDPYTGNIYTLNLFTIQPEGVTFSLPPVLHFDDHDNLPAGTDLRIFRYGSWEDQTPQSGINKETDGSIQVAEGILKGGTYAVTPGPLTGLPEAYETTQLTGRLIYIYESEDNYDKIPLPGVEVTGMFNGGRTDADGRFSFEVLAKLTPAIGGGDGRIALQAMAFTLIDNIPYAGRGVVVGSLVNPGGVTDLGDIEMEKMMALVSMIPDYYDANVDPEHLLADDDTSGVQFRFSTTIYETSFIHEYPNDSKVLDIVRMPMLESLYKQKLLAIPDSWGEFDPFAYDCTVDEMDISLGGCNEECNEKCNEECIKDDECIKPDCIKNCDGIEDQNECIAECIADEKECIAQCSEECRGECGDTAIFKLNEDNFGEEDYYNQWYFVFLKEMEDGITGKEDGDVFFDPDLTLFSSETVFGKTAAALVNYMGETPRLFTMFATKEDPSAEKSPLVGVLVPDDTDPSGYLWHDYDTLLPDSTIEVEAGSILRIQAEDQTWMRRIVAKFGEESFNKDTMDESEDPFLMHLEIPMPEEASPDPIVLSVTAEGYAAQFLKAVNGLDGHIKSFQVNIQIVASNNSPKIESIDPNIGITANQTIAIHITGQNFTNVHTITILDPQGGETQLDFTVVDDTSITLQPYVFAVTGQHRIILTADEGETEGIVVVVPEQVIARYTITDLGMLAGGKSVEPMGINSSGQVAGRMVLSLNSGFFWTQGSSIQSLTPLAGSYASWAIALNDSGDVVGISFGNLSLGYDGTLWHADGTITKLPDLGVDKGTFPYGINNSGLVVGASQIPPGGRHHAFTWRVGSSIMADLGTLDSSYQSSLAYGVNNAGQVVGISTDASQGGRSTACLWSGGGIIQLGNEASGAQGINDAGLVVGVQGNIAHVWNGAPGGTSLGGLGGIVSYAYAVNNSGQIVGWSSTPAGGYDHAVLWENGEILDLNDLHDGTGWLLRQARGINDAGQIAGKGIFNGKDHGFLLTPVE
jgi:probable HAF family extracellular repeat protein